MVSYPQSYHQGYPPQQGYSQQPQYDQQQQAYGQQQQGYPPPQQHAPPETTDSGSYQNIHYTIKHRNTNSTLNLQLGPNDLIKAKPGAMIHMSPTVKLEGAIKFSMRKMLTGSQMSEASFTGPGTVALAPTLMGDIVALQIANDGRAWNVGKDAFLASTGEVKRETKSQGFSKAMFSGEDLFIYKLMGQGLVWLTSYGAVDVIHLQEGEQHIVDNGHLVAWNCDYKIEKAASGSWSSVKSGEGLVCRFTGPGTIYMQTRNLDDFASWTFRPVCQFGFWQRLFLKLAFPDALDLIDRIHKDVIQNGTPHAATITRDLMCAKYNMTAVAAVVIAQVAISGLGLDEIAKTHWTVQASFIISLVSGLLSVFYCCIIQQDFGTLVSPDDVKDWLCTPGEWHGMEEELQEQFALLRPGNETTGTKEQLQTIRDRVIARLQSHRWETPSINSAVILVAPVRLLNLAVTAFLTGLGVYLGLVFSQNINIAAGYRGNLANMIIYILVVVINLLLFGIPTVLRFLARLPRQRVKREAYHIKLMLNTYKELDDLKRIAKSISRDKARWASSEIESRFEDVQYAIMIISDKSSAASQEAIQELTAKLKEVAAEMKLPIPPCDSNSGAYSSPFGRFRGHDAQRSGSLHQQSCFEQTDHFLDAGNTAKASAEADRPDNSNRLHLSGSGRDTKSQQWKAEISTGLSPIIQALGASTTTQARMIGLLEQLLSSSQSEERMMEQIVSHFASAEASGAS
ncbi:hypothetical protein KC332_g2370 [Hortaea werneckii]|nr:hypothetical protein KC358_g3828 [Hortaea werneckii]KAI6932885.1 hypothetical protein KC348_g6861 [Hortaea werneckii]KAI6942270.1 hypothetical protein KC341_g2360 [Hortaea werneckii]KAI6976904.1 hypothetical protein KC321_g3758 [Hortaea werneckii]KAI6994455.1 hypothetical protein KC329_g2819 [Hortaea werneckii]